MKNIIYLLMIAWCITFFSCTNDEFYNDKTTKPSISVSFTPENPKVGDTVVFTITGDADYVSIFSGDSLHEYNYSKVKSEIEYGIDIFNDTVFKRRTSLENSVYRVYFEDYDSVEDVKNDFSFFGAIDENSIELGEFDPPKTSLVASSRPKQLKFTIKDRRIPSGFSFKPNIHLFNWLMYIEMRLVPDDTDYQVRFGASNRDNREITAGWRTHFYDVEEEQTYVAGTNPASFGDYQKAGFYPGYELLPDADPNFDPNGFLNDWWFHCSKTYDAMVPPNGSLPGGKREFWDIKGRHAAKINPNCNYVEKPERALISQCDVLIGGSTYKLWEAADNYPITSEGIPANEANYGSLMNFQGDVYLTSIEWGWHTYAPYDEGVNLGSVYSDQKETFSYVYSKPGEFKVNVVATNTGLKNYTGNGYQDQRNYSASEYGVERAVKEVSINVTN